MPRFCARLWDRELAMARLLPYCEQQVEDGNYLPARGLAYGDYTLTNVRTANLTSLTPTPRLAEHMPPKYAVLLLR